MAMYLVGEGFEQFDLFLAERLRSGPYYRQGANDDSLTQERDADGGSNTRGSRLVRALELRIGDPSVIARPNVEPRSGFGG